MRIFFITIIFDKSYFVCNQNTNCLVSCLVLQQADFLTSYLRFQQFVDTVYSAAQNLQLQAFLAELSKYRRLKSRNSKEGRNLFECRTTYHFLRLLLEHIGLLQLKIRKQFTIYRNSIVARVLPTNTPMPYEGKTTKCTFGMMHRLETNLRAYECNCRSV